MHLKFSYFENFVSIGPASIETKLKTT